MTMTPERWRRVKALFDEALDQPTEERTRWLESATAGDPDLFGEVASLLDALREERDRFERSPLLTGPAGDEPAGPALGERVGPYRLIRGIGEGGMGVVFEAYRDDDQYRKRVAIKTISAGRNRDLILRRFRYERQILARLEHRNIAGLLDGGVTEQGEPFFAMEFVEGLPIDRYCDERGLDVRERLQLFRQVCAAVQYAHQNLVIHRDLKPSNILVTADGTAKLLDFGIAKLLREDDGSEGGEGLTQPGMVPLTTAYASPEQLRGDAVTTATDVFSLGVVLYRLLAGVHPFARDLPAGQELARRIREQAPLPPSAAVTADTASQTGELRRLSRTLQGDLDSIVLMALRKEPARRYASVERLGEDLLRYLAGLPVAAQPDRMAYRVGKFVRRHRTAMLAAGLGGIALLGGLGATAWQAGVARQERDLARRERARAERISQFLQNTLGAADPSWYTATERPGPQTPIGTLFDAAGKRAEAELAAQPEVLADVLATLGRGNQALRRIDLAKPQLERAHALHLRLEGPASAAVAADEHDLGSIAIAAGDYPTAERWMKQALDRLKTLGDSTSDIYGRVLGDLGLVYLSSGRPSEGERFTRLSAEHRHRFDSAGVANMVLLGNLGLALSAQGKLDSAEPVYRAALAGYERLRPREYFEEGFTLGNLATDYVNRGRFRDAMPLARQQVAHFSRLLAPTHPNVAYGWITLARALLGLGEYRQALDTARKAEAIFRAVPLPEGHPDYARTELVQGQILTAMERFPEAEGHLRKALAIRRARLAKGSAATADAETFLALLLTKTSRFAEAESLLATAIPAYLVTYGRGDPRTIRALGGLTVVCDAGHRQSACSARDSLVPGTGGAP